MRHPRRQGRRALRRLPDRVSRRAWARPFSALGHPPRRVLDPGSLAIRCATSAGACAVKRVPPPSVSGPADRSAACAVPGIACPDRAPAPTSARRLRTGSGNEPASRRRRCRHAPLRLGHSRSGQHRLLRIPPVRHAVSEWHQRSSDRCKCLLCLWFPAGPAPSYSFDGLTDSESRKAAIGGARLWITWKTGTAIIRPAPSPGVPA